MPGQNIIGVQFRRSGKIYEFESTEALVRIGDQVVVETERGPSLAEVVKIAFMEFEEPPVEEIKPILRIANDHDMREAKRLTSDYAENFSQERVKTLDLDMRIIKADVQFGGNKVIIYFSAPGRVDFRELVKELASGLKARVELKQVGARDEAKLTGGLGICGREYCCSSFLREFVPVSIKMAKNQNLALNPSKVSGGCGRLLCCLTYEDDVYTELRQKLLPKKTRVRLPGDGGFGDVLRGDVLNQKMLIETDKGEQISVAISELEVVERGTGTEDDEWGDDLDLGGLMEDTPSPRENRSDAPRAAPIAPKSARGGSAGSSGGGSNENRADENRSSEGTSSGRPFKGKSDRPQQGPSRDSNREPREGQSRDSNREPREGNRDSNRETRVTQARDGNREPRENPRESQSREPRDGQSREPRDGNRGDRGDRQKGGDRNKGQRPSNGPQNRPRPQGDSRPQQQDDSRPQQQGESRSHAPGDVKPQPQAEGKKIAPKAPKTEG